MKKTLRSLVVVFAIFGMLFMVSCASQKTDTVTPEETTDTMVEENVTDDNMEAEEAARLEEERLRQEESARMEAQEAMEMFVSEDIHFDFDDASLKADAQEILQRKAVWMNNNPEATIIIEGHCDERGTTEYNVALGDRRASAAKSFLSDLGVDMTRIKTISYGEEMPVDPGHNEAAWSKNRRAHCVIE